MIVTPDWTRRGTIEELERQMVDFKFQGCGFYIGTNCFTIVVPQNPRTPTTWRPGVYNKSEIFEFHVYNCDINQTIFGKKVELREYRDNCFGLKV